MKKTIVYIIIGILILGVLFYTLGEQGLLGGLLGLVGIGGSKKLTELKKQGEKLDQEAKKLNEEIKEIEKQKEELKPKELTDEEEVDYWKDQ